MTRWAVVSPEEPRARDLAHALVADKRIRQRTPNGTLKPYELDTMAVYVHRLAKENYHWWQQDERRAEALASALKLPRHRLPFGFAPDARTIAHHELPALKSFDPKGRAKPFAWCDVGPRGKSGRGKDPFQFGQLGAGEWVVMPCGTGMRFLYHYHRIHERPVCWVNSLDDLRLEDGKLLGSMGDAEIEVPEPGWVFVGEGQYADVSWLGERRITVIARREPPPDQWGAALTVRPRAGWRREYLVDWVAKRFRNPRSPDFDVEAVADELDRVDPQERLVATPSEVLRFASQEDRELPETWEDALTPLIRLAGGGDCTEQLVEALVEVASVMLVRPGGLFDVWELGTVGIEESLAARLVHLGALSFVNVERYQLARTSATTGALLEALRRRIASGSPWHTAALVGDRRDLVDLFLRCCSPPVFRAVAGDVVRGDATAPEDVAAALVCFRALGARLDQLEWTPEYEALARWLYAGTSDDSYPHKWFWVPEQQIAATWKLAGRLRAVDLPCWLFPRDRTRDGTAPDWLVEGLDHVIPGHEPNPPVWDPPRRVAELLSALPEIASCLPDSPRSFEVLRLFEGIVTGDVTAETFVGWDDDLGRSRKKLVLMRLVDMPQTQDWLQSQRSRWSPTTAAALVELTFGRELDQGARIERISDCFRTLPELIQNLLPEIAAETWQLLLADRVLDSLETVPAALHEVILQLAPLDEPRTSFILVDVAPTLALDHLEHLMDIGRIDQLWASYPQEVIAKLRESPNIHVIRRCPSTHASEVLDVLDENELGFNAARWLREMLTAPGVDHARVFRMLGELGEL